MKVFIAFLIIAFVVGGRAAGAKALPRPLVVLGCCVLVAASFLSLRVIG
ncbi:MAG: hypothetical protein ABIQ39_02355 [Ilumatobacteraceae bacterium]